MTPGGMPAGCKTRPAGVVVIVVAGRVGLPAFHTASETLPGAIGKASGPSC